MNLGGDFNEYKKTNIYYAFAIHTFEPCTATTLEPNYYQLRIFHTKFCKAKFYSLKILIFSHRSSQMKK